MRLLTFIIAIPFVLHAQLTKEQAVEFRDSLWADHQQTIRKERSAEMQKKVIRIGDHSMRFESKKYGKKPKEGWNLFIC